MDDLELVETLSLKPQYYYITLADDHTAELYCHLLM